LSDALAIPKMVLDFCADAVDLDDITCEGVNKCIADHHHSGAAQYAQDVLYKPLLVTNSVTVHSVPLLTPELCDLIVERARNHTFTVNDEEEAPFQIRESVLEATDPELYKYLQENILDGIRAWLLLAYQTVYTECQIQIARYSPNTTYGTGYHFDADSDVTMVISLNPDDFEGGGTSVRTTFNTEHYIAPLVKGNALMFPGKLLLHKGEPVTEGVRYLLVLWMKL
jgi:hypothetical protein